MVIKGNNMIGKIVKGIAGFYYVDVVESGIYECKAKGIFRKEKKKPLVGDNVEIDIIDSKEYKGNIIEILPRENELIRPLVANVDQAMVVFSITQPKPHFNLLDRFLVMMEEKEIPTIIVFNKKDIATESEIQELRDVYKSTPYTLVFSSGETEEKIETIKELLKGKTTVIAGPSGVGKSTIINAICPEAKMETGEISEKIQRGKHTTRHSELFTIDKGSYIMDTPGFSSLYVNDFEKEELKFFFPEFNEVEKPCQFNGCNHIHEPKCAIKDKVEEGKIHKVRYENYKEMYKELEERKRY